MKTQGRPGNSAVRKHSIRVISLAVGGLIVAGMVTTAAAYWQVHDQASYQVLQEIKRETEKTKENVKTFDDNVQPKGQWNSTSNKGVYKPFESRDDDKYKYYLLDKLTAATVRDVNFGVKEKCGDTATATEDDVWKNPELPASGGGLIPTGSDPVKAQEKICATTMIAENLKFNETIRMANRIKHRNDAIKKMNDQRSEFEKQGALDADTNNLQMFIAEAQIEIQYSQAMIAAYESQIHKFSQANDMQAKRAMDGPKPAPGPLNISASTIARAGTLCGALTVFKSGSSDFNCGTVISDLF